MECVPRFTQNTAYGVIGDNLIDLELEEAEVVSERPGFAGKEFRILDG